MLAFGSPPRLLDIPRLAFGLAQRLSSSTRVGSWLQPLMALLAALCATWFLAQALPFYAQLFVGPTAATALATACSVMILWSGSEAMPPLRRLGIGEESGIVWTRGFAAPVLLYSLLGVYAPVLFKLAILLGRSWPAALMLARAVHLPAARLSELALCLVQPQRQRLWTYLLRAEPSPGPWRGEELRALAAPQSRACMVLLEASFALMALAALWTRWP
jgi:hypothetical protein